jgi:hypothetical protein
MSKAMGLPFLQRLFVVGSKDEVRASYCEERAFRRGRSVGGGLDALGFALGEPSGCASASSMLIPSSTFHGRNVRGCEILDSARAVQLREGHPLREVRSRFAWNSVTESFFD